MAVLSLTAGGESAAGVTANRPNVLVILADDQGWGDLSRHGNLNLRTPNLDSIAELGASFTRFYVQPVCSPTRAEFLTGRFHPRDGVLGVTSGRERLDARVETIADAFRAAGYATGCFGKWHNGTQAPYHPRCRGFDEFYGFCSGHWGMYFNPMLDHNGQIVRGKGYLADDLTNHAIDFMRQSSSGPFFTFVAFNTPHSPMQVPDRWWRKFDGARLKLRGTDSANEELDHTRAALAMCENLDWNVGRLLRALKHMGLDENTIVVFFSDNGPNGHRFNGQLRGVKGYTDEGGVKSPLFLRWPRKIAGGTTIESIVGAIDLAPTLCELAGIEAPNAGQLDGFSFRSALTGGQTTTKDRILFSHWAGRLALRTQDYLLDHEGRLFNVSSDPLQKTDVSEKYPRIVARLNQEASRWREDFLAPPRSVRPFTIGHSGLPSTQLPARDATTRGDIQRSSKHPNCSYFTNWKTAQDTIEWDVEVVESGEFIAELYYTCAAADVGSLVELRLGDAAITGRVTPAHDPPIVSEVRNRYPASEGPIKKFKPLKLGVIRLPTTKGRLTLRATQVTGKQVMDFRLLVLTRVAGG